MRSDALYPPRDLLSSRQLLGLLVPFLSFQTEGRVENAVVIVCLPRFSSFLMHAQALQRFHPTSHAALLDELSSLATSALQENKKPGKRKKEYFRSRLALIYSYVSDHLSPLALRSEKIRTKLIHFIEDLLEYFKTSPPSYETLQLSENFCVLVRGVVRGLYFSATPGRTFNQALRRSLFSLFQQWCFDDFGLPQNEEFRRRLESFLATVKDPTKKKNYAGMVQERILALQFSALQTSSLLLLGPYFQPLLPADPIFDWFSRLLHSDHPIVAQEAQRALTLFLQDSISVDRSLLRIALDSCFSPDQALSTAYFLALVERFEDEFLPLPEAVIVLLIMYHFGSRQPAVRRAAHRLLIYWKAHVQETGVWADLPLSIAGGEAASESNQKVLASYLSAAHSDAGLTSKLLDEVMLRMDLVGHRGRRQFLELSLPWLRSQKLSKLRPATLMAQAKSMLHLTHLYVGDYPVEVERMWQALSQGHQTNTALMLDTFIALGQEKHNSQFLVHAKRACMLLGRADPDAAIRALMRFEPDLRAKPAPAPLALTPTDSPRGTLLRESSHGSPIESDFQALLANLENPARRVSAAEVAPPSSEATSTPSDSESDELTLDLGLQQGSGLHPFDELIPTLSSDWALSVEQFRLVLLCQLSFEVRLLLPSPLIFSPRRLARNIVRTSPSSCTLSCCCWTTRCRSCTRTVACC